MTPQSIITIARSIVNDTEAGFYRVDDATLVGYVNDGLKELSRLVPAYFQTIGDLTCEQNKTEQLITFADAQEIVAVIRIHQGRAVLPMDIMELSSFNPDWATDTQAEATNWAKLPNDPLRFYIYPPAPALQTLDILYIRNPSTYALNDDITEVPESVAPALADYVIYRIESRDDEHVISTRAISHYQSFVQKVVGVAAVAQPEAAPSA